MNMTSLGSASNDTRVIQELYDPIAFMEPAAYRKAVRRNQINALICLGIGLGLLALIIISPTATESGHSGRSGGGAVLFVFIMPGMILYGLYALMTAKEAVKEKRRAQLVWLNPGLKPIEAERQRIHPANPWPLRIIKGSTYLLVAIVIATILYNFILWLHRALT